MTEPRTAIFAAEPSEDWTPGYILTLDESGVPVWEPPSGEGGGGGFAGWTETGDPADVESNGGDMGVGALFSTSGVIGGNTLDSGNFQSNWFATSDDDDGTLELFSVVILMPQIPTADPVNEGQLWNDGGTLKVSAG